MTAADGDFGLRTGEARFVSRIAARAIADAAAHEIVYGSCGAERLISALAKPKGPSVSQFEALRWYCLGDAVRDGKTAKRRITKWLKAAKTRAKDGRGWKAPTGDSENSQCVADALGDIMLRACDVQEVVLKAAGGQAPDSAAGQAASVMLSQARIHLGDKAVTVLADLYGADLVSETLSQVITLLADEVRASRTNGIGGAD